MRSDNADELVRRAKQGDQRAFNALIEPRRPQLVRFVMRIVNNTDDAEDIVQVALTRAHLSLARFRGECAFSTWLTEIAINTTKNFLKKRAHDPLHLREEPSQEFDDDKLDFVVSTVPDIDTPEAILEAKQRGDVVARAWAFLVPELAETFRLYNEHGLSYQEIADRLGIPVGTVRSRIHRAKKALGLR